MTFTVGETVVYPNHGAAVIEDIETRQIKGEDKLYLVLRIIGQNDLVVRVPACNLDLVGVRDVVDADGLERVFQVLRAEHTEEPTNWSRRYKANLEKLHSGNVIKVSEVVRDLWRRDRDKGLSAGEKRMLAKARAILPSMRIKAAVVAADEREAGVRAHLNFGHTFGHAIEVGAGYGKWLHGEAVAAGMVMAADLSVRLGRMPAEQLDELRRIITSANLPTRAPAWPVDDYLRNMAIDKKAEHGIPVFVVLNGLGHAATTRADEALVRAVIADHLR